MEIYCLRHGPVKVNHNICYGWTDVEPEVLSDEETSIFDIDSFDHVELSPLKRCLYLAQRVGLSKGHVDERIMELNFGDWELMDWDAVFDDQGDVWMNDYVNQRCPQGESYQDLYERVASWFNELIKKEYKKVLVVTHSGVIRALISHVGNVSLRDTFDYDVDYLSVSKITAKNKGFMFNYINKSHVKDSI